MSYADGEEKCFLVETVPDGGYRYNESCFCLVVFCEMSTRVQGDGNIVVLDKRSDIRYNVCEEALIMTLQTLLNERNISMYRLSKISGVSKTIIIDICSGKSALENCTAKTVYSIAQALGCSVEDLLEAYSSVDVFTKKASKSLLALEQVQYITGIHALNIPCSLNTSGDWHASALSWSQPSFKNTKDSVFGVYGVELSENVPENPGKYFVANHIRACLDLIEDGRFSLVQSMRNDFICNDEYNQEIFLQVSKLQHSPNWEHIRRFMKKEYRTAWLNFEGSYLYV